MVIILSLAPGQTVGRFDILRLPHSDKIAHVGFYLILAGLLLRAYGLNGAKNFRKAFVTAAVICIVLGFVLEVLQHAGNAQRHFEVLDIIANIIGTLCGGALFNLLLKTKYYGS